MNNLNQEIGDNLLNQEKEENDSGRKMIFKELLKKSVYYALILSMISNGPDVKSLKANGNEKHNRIKPELEVETQTIRNEIENQIKDLSLDNWGDLYELFDLELLKKLGIKNGIELQEFFLHDEILREFIRFFLDEHVSIENDETFKDLKKLKSGITEADSHNAAADFIEEWINNNPSDPNLPLLFFFIDYFSESEKAAEILKTAGMQNAYLAFKFFPIYKNKIPNAIKILDFLVENYQNIDEIARFINKEENIYTENNTWLFSKSLQERKTSNLANFDKTYEKAKSDWHMFFEKDIHTTTPEIISKILKKYIYEEVASTCPKIIKPVFRKEGTTRFWSLHYYDFDQTKIQDFPEKWIFQEIAKHWELFKNYPDAKFILGTATMFAPSEILSQYHKISSHVKIVPILQSLTTIIGNSKEEIKKIKKELNSLDIGESSKQEILDYIFITKELAYTTKDEAIEKTQKILNSIHNRTGEYQMQLIHDLFLRIETLADHPKAKKLFLHASRINTSSAWDYMHLYTHVPWVMEIAKSWILHDTRSSNKKKEIKNSKFLTKEQKEELFIFIEKNEKDFQNILEQHNHPKYKAFKKDPALPVFEKLKNLGIDKNWLPIDKQSEFNNERKIEEFLIIIARNIYYQKISEKTLTDDQVKQAIEKEFKDRETYKNVEITKNRNVRHFASSARWPQLSKLTNDYFYAPIRFGRKASQEGLKKDSKSFEFNRPQNTPESISNTKQKIIETIENSPSPLTIVLEGHGTNNRYFFASDDPFISSTQTQQKAVRKNRSISYKELAKAFEKRHENFPEESTDINKTPIIVLAECNSQNLIRSMYDEMDCPLPIGIVLSEYGQVGENLLYPEIDSKYGFDMFPTLLQLKKKNHTPVIQDIYNNDIKHRHSNPSLFAPDPLNPEIIIQLTHNINKSTGSFNPQNKKHELLVNNNTPTFAKKTKTSKSTKNKHKNSSYKKVPTQKHSLLAQKRTRNKNPNRFT